VKIPEQLKTGFRFLKLKGKVPIDKQWGQENNYSYEETQKWINQGENYGVLCGHNSLVVLDFDNIDYYNKLPKESEFLKTFSVKTNKGVHLYVKLHENIVMPKKSKIRTVDLDGILTEVGDFQALGSQVVGPGSLHPTGSIYEVVNDLPIIQLTEEQSKSLIEKITIYDTKKIKGVKFGNTIVEIKDRSLLTEEILKHMDIKQMLIDEGITNTYNNPCMCPLKHESEGEKCFGYNEELKIFHCFHCGSSGNSIELYRQIETLKNIDKNDKRRNSPEVTYSEARKKLIAKYGIKVDELIEANKDDILEDKERVKEAYITLHLDGKFDSARELVTSYILSKHYFFTILEEKSNNTYYFDPTTGMYCEGGSNKIRELVKDILGEKSNRIISKEIVSDIEELNFIKQKEFLMEPNEDLILVKNGILNIKTKELSSFNPEIRFFQRIPINYDPEAKCPNIEKFLENTVVDPISIEIIKQFAGELLYRRYKSQTALILTADGNNGKSKVIELLRRFIGEDNTVGVSLKDLSEDTYAGAELHRRLLNANADIDNNRIDNTSMFKQATGEDKIRVRKIYSSPFHIYSYAKLLYSCNGLPIVSDNSPGFFRRWRLIGFPVTFVTKKVLDDNYGGKESECIKLEDPNILRNTVSSEEMSGFLNLALSSLSKLINNRFTYPFNTLSKNIVVSWARMANPMYGFMEDMLCEENDSFVSLSEIRDIIGPYFKKHRLGKMPTYNTINYNLTTELNGEEIRKEVKGKLVRGWRGIKIKENTQFTKITGFF